MSPAQTLDHYAEMLRLTEQQAELADRGELEALAPLGRRFEELTATLPERAPAGAAALLARAALISQRTETRIAEMQQTLMHDVAIAAKASRAARGYALASRRKAHIDHCV
jgi:hypothetical protein